MPGRLIVVATPIGNLEDLSSRAAQTLREVDLVACEDTRRTGRLMAHLGAKRLAEFLAEDDPTVSAGNFEDPYRHFFWKFESGKKFGDLDQLPEGAADNLQRLDLQVGDERRDQVFTITRYRFRVDSP